MPRAYYDAVERCMRHGALHEKSVASCGADSPLVPHQGLWYSVRPMPNKALQGTGNSSAIFRVDSS